MNAIFLMIKIQRESGKSEEENLERLLKKDKIIHVIRSDQQKEMKKYISY